MINNKTIKIICIIVMAAGLFGMLYCWRFLYSTNMADLVGAGFPFVAGSILLGCGLIGLVLNNRK
jgi:hypothetical protein